MNEATLRKHCHALFEKHTEGNTASILSSLGGFNELSSLQRLPSVTLFGVDIDAATPRCANLLGPCASNIRRRKLVVSFNVLHAVWLLRRPTPPESPAPKETTAIDPHPHPKRGKEVVRKRRCGPALSVSTR